MLSDHVLFIDGEAIILDKPAGLPVDPPRDGSISLENHLASLTFGFARWPLAVHRLDRDTSGCLLLARNPKAHKRFSAAFEKGLVEKYYVAVVDGIPEEENGVIDLPLLKTSTARTGWRMTTGETGKPARTRWRKVAEKDGRALIGFSPETGRTHQIRVHAQLGLGLPIVGDPVYGAGGTAMLLHARRLAVPRQNKPPVEALAPIPGRFHAAGFSHDDLDGDS